MSVAVGFWALVGLGLRGIFYLAAFAFAMWLLRWAVATVLYAISNLIHKEVVKK